MTGAAPGTRSRAVLVTGGTGLIGSHVVERLARSGAPVRVASRSGRWEWGPVPPGVECVAVDLRDRGRQALLEELVHGTRTIVHLAGMLLRPGVPEESYRELHVDAVRRLVAAVRSAPGNGRRRLVHVSTTGVLGPTGADPIDESSEPHPSTPYEQTKLEGERVAMAAREAGIEVVIVRPGLVYGPRDLHLLGLYRAVDRGLFRTIAGGHARWQPIHVADVARGIERAAECEDVDGEVFHVAGSETVAVADFADRIAAALGRSVRGPSLPYGLAMAAGAALEYAARPFGVDPPLSRSRVRTLTEDRLYRIDRARDRLGFTPATGLDEGLAQTVAWYRDQGYLR
jgi:nucleoside-diphosphate-sugar epimerase